MIRVYLSKAELSAAEAFEFDRMFGANKLEHAQTFVIAGSRDELYNFGGFLPNLEIRYNQEDFAQEECEFWYGVVCW